MVAEHARDFGSHLQRPVHAHHVEHQLGALPPCDVVDPLNRLITGDQCLVGSHLSGRLEFVGSGVDGDDRGRGAQCPQ